MHSGFATDYPPHYQRRTAFFFRSPRLGIPHRNSAVTLKMPPAGRSDPPHHPDDRTVGYFVILTTLVTKLKTAFL
jgi:hypothetical protein